jgi:hypothetical protein
MFRYIKNKKHSGKDLRLTIIKAINFMNKDVKTPLGIKVSSKISTPKINTLDGSAAKDKSLFGG